jgi:hypothetical protein
MAERFRVPVEFQRLDDVAEHGRATVVAMRAVLDGGTVSDLDEGGAFYVEVEAENRDEANTMVWNAAEEARVTDFIDFVGRRTT